MQCPACGNRMTEVKTGDITVDACTGGCGGLWFDHFELRKVDEPAQSAGESLLNIPQNPKVTVDQSQRRKCPRDREMFDTQLGGMLKQDKAKYESARKVARIFKFICPSYYLPGKQDWGAF